MSTRILPEKNGLKERETKLFQAKISLGIFQGGEEEVERGEIEEYSSHHTLVKISQNPLQSLQH